METTQGYYVLFWTNPERSKKQNNNCMATDLLSCKLSKKGEEDILGYRGVKSSINW